MSQTQELLDALRAIMPFRNHLFGCEVDQTDVCTCGMKQAADTARAAMPAGPFIKPGQSFRLWPRSIDEAHAVHALRRLLEAVDSGQSSCRYDHHGNCQEHYLGNPCEVAVARGILQEIDSAKGPDELFEAFKRYRDEREKTDGRAWRCCITVHSDGSGHLLGPDEREILQFHSFEHGVEKIDQATKGLGK